jgi:hypothetical protein
VRRFGESSSMPRIVAEERGRFHALHEFESVGVSTSGLHG